MSLCLAFSSKRKLHKKTKHTSHQKIRQRQISKKPGTFQFVTCGKNTKTPMKLVRVSKVKCIKKNRELAASQEAKSDSKLIQTDYEPYKCDRCDYKCRRNADLYTHTSKHSAENPYTCNLCLYKTNTISRLMTHKLIHIKKEVHKYKGGRSLECSLCDYKTSCGSLKRHMKSFGYRCNETGVLKTYMSEQNEEKLFKCNLCNYKCKWSGTLKKHFTNEHAGK